MRRADRTTPAGVAYLALQKRADQVGRPTGEFITLYALEGFLDRLARSGRSPDLVLKGGVLLAAYAVRRPTRDVDLAARQQANDPDEVLALIKTVAAVHVDDGLVFDTDTATAQPIRDQDQYAGVRVSLGYTLATAKSRFHVDVNFGDPISPAPQTIALPRLLGGEVQLVGYPLHMVLAEKLITALSLATVSTRWRDYAGVYVLTRRHPVTGADLQAALVEVAHHRQVDLRPLSPVLVGYSQIAGDRYLKWVRKHRLNDRLPADFDDLVDPVTAFADPALTGSVDALSWSPTRLAWEPEPT